MRIRLSRRAQQDPAEIGRYLRPRSQAGALKVREQLQAALHVIRDHPQAGRSIGGGLHRFAVPRVPYLIFYRVDDAAATVLVVTIRHGARKPLLS